MIGNRAKGYVLKNATAEGIIDFILYVNEGFEFFQIK